MKLVRKLAYPSSRESCSCGVRIKYDIVSAKSAFASPLNVYLFIFSEPAPELVKQGGATIAVGSGLLCAVVTVMSVLLTWPR